MKTVQITFGGPKSEEMAKRFFFYLVDGGLEDQVIQGLAGNGAELEISDCNIGDLAVLFQCRETPLVTRDSTKKRVSRKGVRK